MSQDFCNLPEEIISFLKEKKVVVDSSEVNDYFYDAKVRYLTSAYCPESMTLIIAPTTNCNFACPYCFEPKTNPKTMTNDVEDKLIEYINNQRNPDKISLTWYGGEPLLAFSRIEKLHDRIANECDKKIVGHSMITNGYLITDSVIEFMKRSKMDNVQITVDGTELNHNTTRRALSGKSQTYKTIINNIERLSVSIPQISISLRVNINKKNYQDFLEIYRQYSGVQEFRNIHVYPGIIREENEDHCEFCQSTYTSSEILDLYEIFQQKGVNINFLPDRAVKGCMLQRVHSFIVGPEGELYKCWNDVSNPSKVVGSIMDDKKRNYTLLMSYMNEVNPFEKDCRECSIFPICDGGCGNLRYRNLHEGGRFDYCSALKKSGRLEKSLTLSIKHPAKDGEFLQIK